MKTLLFSAVCLLALTCLTSCYTEFKNPLPHNSAQNESLLGDWVIYENDILKQQLYIWPTEGDWYTIVRVGDIDKGIGDKLEIGYCKAFSSKLNARTFFNVKVDQCDNNFIVGYKLTEPNRLEIFLVSNDKIKILIKSGVLKGEVKEGNILKHELERVVVTSTTDEIVNVLKDIPHDQLFYDDAPSHLTFTRPKSYKEE
ncbi:MAG: hypothetical protein LLF76_12950 [Planctomycetaceae bacterium]|nr:hypothetical protein [Planctomycetaceae bacterium]